MRLPILANSCSTKCSTCGSIEQSARACTGRGRSFDSQTMQFGCPRGKTTRSNRSRSCRGDSPSTGSRCIPKRRDCTVRSECCPRRAPPATRIEAHELEPSTSSWTALNRVHWEDGRGRAESPMTTRSGCRHGDVVEEYVAGVTFITRVHDLDAVEGWAESHREIAAGGGRTVDEHVGGVRPDLRVNDELD